MEITEVLERVLAGDRQAYSLVVAEYEQALFGFLGRMGLAQGRAEDVAQETFLRVWLKLADFDSRRASFSTWLFTIARRLALNELERAAPATIAAHDGAIENADTAPQPDESLVISERQAVLQQALLGLSLQDRTTLALVYVSGISLADVARIENASVGTIRTRVHRARQRLLTILKDDQ